MRRGEEALPVREGCHPRGSGGPGARRRVPACAGMTGSGRRGLTRIAKSGHAVAGGAHGNDERFPARRDEGLGRAPD